MAAVKADSASLRLHENHHVVAQCVLVAWFRIQCLFTKLPECFLQILKNVLNSLNSPFTVTKVASLKPDLHISHKDRKHMFANMSFKLSKYGLVSK